MTSREKQLSRKLLALFELFTFREMKQLLQPWNPAVTIPQLRDLQRFLQGKDANVRRKNTLASSPGTFLKSSRKASDLPSLLADDRELVIEAVKKTPSSSREFARWLEVIGSVNERSTHQKKQSFKRDVRYRSKDSTM